MKKEITKRQKELLGIIYQYILNSGFPPTFEEMREELGVASNQSVIDLLKKLIEKDLVRRNEAAARGISLLPFGYEVLGKPALVPFLGSTTAGMPVEAIEISGEWMEIPSRDEQLHRLKEEVFLLRVNGDSMINAGIDDGDTVLVQSKQYFVTNEIVLAQVGDESTVKRFIKEDKPPYTYLKPENPKYDVILFKDDVELKGKVLSVLNKGAWCAVS